MSAARVFVSRLIGLGVFDPIGDRVGQVRDVVVQHSSARQVTRVIGLVLEVPGRRRVFLPMTRITSIDAGQVITTGLLNMRRFERRPREVLVQSELFDRQVHVRLDEDDAFDATVEDIGITQQRNRDWHVAKVFVRKADPTQRRRLNLRRRGETLVVDVDAVSGLHTEDARQGADRLIESFEELKPADVADALQELTPKRRREVADALPDEKLADVLEELPEEDRVAIVADLSTDRAADVLEAMQPDDAADLLGELPDETAAELLGAMEPEEAEPLRTLLTYGEDTAGGMMTTEPVILGADASIAEALATVRRAELHPALAAMVFVCRSPLEVPTGKLLGVVHLQRMLREPPHESIGAVVDSDIEPLDVDASLGEVTRSMANYNMISLPVVDSERRLLGAVTVDDVLDHILPDDWREDRDEAAPDVTAALSVQDEEAAHGA
ncbi:magnesium transporter [Kytococcus sedentarius]|uniref:Mg/Co/Ni transporter MgtE with CBS domain n=1 Tax=Kytococcus sedentarius (strain ATCC 14392 / DSM 20547 / JCM 11482 / CCUG 33030 / NBRC 15357 / NCTC 11040 / CCM 314 / 541) TaxID=478801 RepID=C7NK99_KYTSD|nr:CBS domain-containing protein [Kytococcus sedentarius]ACV06937.1 Mg/Co/Ni transporter MgtE with CBS domain [Kytococcus sedentarius DSM 20547]QQB62943.1 magnesium transporter [Kytococcus sedentarius]STX14239.1 Magnesium transporter mgtE [Kytococcus sedentarius]